MLVNFKIPDFIVVAAARQQQSESKAVAVVQNNRVVAVNDRARRLGLEIGELPGEADDGMELHQVEFELNEIIKRDRELLQNIHKLSPLVERLKFGEYLIELVGDSCFDSWFELIKNDYPTATAGIAASGWLAHLICRCQSPGMMEKVDRENYREALCEIPVSQLWGLGSGVGGRLQQEGLSRLGDFFALPKARREELLGSDSQLLELILQGRDPRPLNCFSKPRELSTKLSLKSIDGNFEKVFETVAARLKKIVVRLEATSSRVYRMRIKLWAKGQVEQTKAVIFPRPVAKIEELRSGLEGVWKTLSAEAGYEAVELLMDGVISDLENYHKFQQSSIEQLEIVDN